MPNGKYDFDYDEPVTIPLDTETTLRAMLGASDGDESTPPPETADESEPSG